MALTLLLFICLSIYLSFSKLNKHQPLEFQSSKQGESYLTNDWCQSPLQLEINTDQSTNLHTYMYTYIRTEFCSYLYFHDNGWCSSPDQSYFWIFMFKQISQNIGVIHSPIAVGISLQNLDKNLSFKSPLFNHMMWLMSYRSTFSFSPCLPHSLFFSLPFLSLFPSLSLSIYIYIYIFTSVAKSDLRTRACSPLYRLIAKAERKKKDSGKYLPTPICECDVN